MCIGNNHSNSNSKTRTTRIVSEPKPGGEMCIADYADRSPCGSSYVRTFDECLHFFESTGMQFSASSAPREK
jgi:hypothetical protein